MTKAKGKAKDRPSELECTAYHEAGHAIVSLFLRRTVKAVSIVPEHDTLGYCESGKASYKVYACNDFDPPAMTQATVQLMISFGGPIAEAKRLRKRDWHPGSDGDVANAISLLRRVCYGGRDWKLLLDWLLHRTKAILRMPWNWRAVELVAEDLLAKNQITGRRARQLHLIARKEHLQRILERAKCRVSERAT